nr:retrovirus-related Pol polyprotein from transposon TNT 1-94 [Tanacetum cinerariifolium]
MRSGLTSLRDLEMPITPKPLTMPISMKENSNDEADERSSEEYLRDLELEFHERAMLAKSRRFIKRTNNFSSKKANEDNECYKYGRKVLKDYKAEYKKIKAQLALLKASPSTSQSSKPFHLKNKGLVAKTFDWDDEEGLDEEEMTQVNVLMALADDEPTMGNNHARNVLLKVIQETAKYVSTAGVNLDKLIESQITDKSKRGLGYVSYNVVPPPHTKRFSPLRIDLSHTGLPEFVEPNVKSYEVKPIEVVTQTSSVKIYKPVKENNGVPIFEDYKSKREDEVESPPEIKRKTVKPSMDKVEVDIPKQNAKPSRRPVKYADMYRTQRPRGGKITGKGILKTGKLDFEDVYFVKELQFNLFSVSQMCDKKNNVLFTNTECFVLSPDFKLANKSHVLVKVPRKNNMYSGDMKNIVPKKDLTCLIAKATNDESMLWHRILDHINFKNINNLVKENLVRGLPSKCFNNDQTCVACLKEINVKPLYRALVVKPHNKTPYELFRGAGPEWLFDIDMLTKSMNYLPIIADGSPLFDSSPKISGDAGKKHDEVSDKEIGASNELNYAFENSNTEYPDDLNMPEKGIKREYSVARTPQQNRVAKRRNRTLIEAARNMLAYSKLPITFWAKVVNTACYVQNRVLVVKPYLKTPYELFRGRTSALSFMRPFGCHVTILNTLDNLGKFDGKLDIGFFVGYSTNSKAFRVYNSRTRKVEENLHINFLENKPIIADSDGDHKVNDAPCKECEIDNQKRPNAKNNTKDVNTTGPSINTASSNINTTSPTVNIVRQNDDFFGVDNDMRRFIRAIYEEKTREYLHTCLFAYFLSQEEPKSISNALKDPAWVEAMQEELLQFHLQKVWTLVDLPQEGIDYDEVIAPVARIKAIRMFLAYASFMGFLIYQMDVKSAFMYGRIEKEVYVCQPLGFEDPNYPDKVYKVEKALYGLHQAPRAWYGTLAKYLLDNEFHRGKIDQTMFIKRQKEDIRSACTRLQVKQKSNGVFISQDKYINEILRKFKYTNVKPASTPMDKEKALLKDSDGDDVDVHLYRISTANC